MGFKRFPNYIFSLFIWGCSCLSGVHARVEIDAEAPNFATQVGAELELMKQGKRGIVCQVLVERLDKSPAVTTIKPVTKEEKTWHPNDRKGTRSHVVPLDTKLRGASRLAPVSVILYLHPSRIDPHLSLFKLGTFVDELAKAVDFNQGTYSGDYRIEERRSTFFRNAWKDSLHSELISLSDRIPTLDYQESKKRGLLTREHADSFPILNASTFPAESPVPSVP